MFQYAVGRALSLRRGVLLKLDVSGFASYGLHQGFELQRVFDCPLDLAGEEDVRGMLGWQSSPNVRRITSKKPFSYFFGKRFVAEPHFHYWSGIDAVPDNCYLSGYWQSERYFESATAEIRKDFTFKMPLSGRNKELAEQISACDAVSLHVRRGDYVSDAKTSSLLGTCSLDYYRTAINHLSERVDSPHFFVFSDDIGWTKENLQLDFPCIYIDHNHGEDSYRDMQLMSLCAHHIIANSSFSWWGAWLNPKEGKIVVAPKRWFAVDYKTDDLIPSEWVIL